MANPIGLSRRASEDGFAQALVSSWWVFASISIFCLLASCSFDQDAPYLPHTQVKYFLYQDSADTQKRLLRIEKEEMELNWQEKWDLSASGIGDMSVYEQQLWISDVEKQEIWEIDPSSGLKKHQIQLQNINPHYICAGAEQLLISDTLQNILAFWDFKKEKLLTFSLIEKPGFAVYRSQKFFLTYDEQQILMYHEKALILIDSLLFPYPITDLQIDNGLFTLVFGKDGIQNYRALIDYNTHAFSEKASPTNIIKARYTPFDRQVYGKEFLFDQIMDENRKISAVRNIQDFETDFFEGNLYFSTNDTLYVFSHWEKTIETFLPFSGNFLKSFFFIAQENP